MAHATQGHTSYLWEIDEPKLALSMGRHNVTLPDIIAALRARYPGCKVEQVEEWVEQISFRGVQTRILKSGIKIDWS